jgi:hypothetical protein
MSDSVDPGCFAHTGLETGIYRDNPALPLGKWDVMANGRIASLDIISVSGSVVSGEYNGSMIYFGQWDASAHLLTFYRFIPDVGGGKSLLQHFSGYLMAYDTGDGAETKWRMAGIFIGTSTAPPPNGPHAGWYATLPRTKKMHVSS